MCFMAASTFFLHFFFKVMDVFERTAVSSFMHTYLLVLHCLWILQSTCFTENSSDCTSCYSLSMPIDLSFSTTLPSMFGTSTEVQIQQDSLDMQTDMIKQHGLSI